jgi:AcrR family transcriptional regulator
MTHEPYDNEWRLILSSPRLQRADAQRNRARILDAAEEVFAAHGAQASTEEVARTAGVAIGTIFRHFPTKDDLVRALMKRLLQQITDDATNLAAQGDPRALFHFFDLLVERTAQNRTVVNLLAPDLPLAGPLGTLTSTVQQLLVRAQEAGTVRPSIQADEVMALLVSTCQGTLHGGWNADLRRRTLDIVYAGLR